MTTEWIPLWGKESQEKNLSFGHFLHFSRRNHHFPSVDICVIVADMMLTTTIFVRMSLCVAVFWVCARPVEQSMKITKVDCISAITPFLFLTKVDEVLELLKMLCLL